MEHFRDPKVLRYQDHWVMILSFAKNSTFAFYKSNDLIHWTYTGNFTYTYKLNPEWEWECPDMFYLEDNNGNGKWFLILNLNPGGYQPGSGARYFVGHFNGHTFTADSQD